MIRSRAPLRISFAGGGTDVPPYPQLYGGCVLSAGIDRYAYTTVQEAGVSSISSDDYVGPPILAKSVLSVFKPKKNFALTTVSEAPPGSGLGSSSALMVSIVKAVSEFLGERMTRYSLAQLAYRLERTELKIKGGLQDQYASTFGGFSFIEFDKGVTVNQLRINPEILQELHASLILIDTGRSRFSGNVLARQIATQEAYLKELDQIKEIARQMKNRLLRGELVEFGQMLGVEWFWKKKLDSRISNRKIDHLYKEVIDRGGLGGKVLGAGDGGHMVFFVPFEKRKAVARFLVAEGHPPINFGFDFEGVCSWKVGREGVQF